MFVKEAWQTPQTIYIRILSVVLMIASSVLVNTLTINPLMLSLNLVAIGYLTGKLFKKYFKCTDFEAAS